MTPARLFRRHFTVAEARELLPRVHGWLAEIRHLQKVVERGGDRNAELFADGRDLGGERINDQIRDLARMRELLGQMEAMDIRIQDLARGLVSFPALRGDREILLCWQEGEPDITSWHEADPAPAGGSKVAKPSSQ